MTTEAVAYVEFEFLANRFCDITKSIESKRVTKLNIWNII